LKHKTVKKCKNETKSRTKKLSFENRLLVRELKVEEKAYDDDGGDEEDINQK